jgi:hypothetical protein
MLWWCPGWESNSLPLLNLRKLLILRYAGVATTAKFARVGYSLGTHSLTRLAAPLALLFVLQSPLALAQSQIRPGKIEANKTKPQAACVADEGGNAHG